MCRNAWRKLSPGRRKALAVLGRVLPVMLVGTLTLQAVSGSRAEKPEHPGAVPLSMPEPGTAETSSSPSSSPTPTPSSSPDSVQKAPPAEESVPASSPTPAPCYDPRIGGPCGSEGGPYPENREIAITITNDNPEPKVGSKMNVTVEAWDADDVNCCVVIVTLDAKVRSWPKVCDEGSGVGEGEDGEITVRKTFTAPQQSGDYVINVHAYSRSCGTTYASEDTGYQAFTVFKPPPPPTPTPTPSPTYSETPSPTPS